jgi:hypothetical protein
MGGVNNTIDKFGRQRSPHNGTGKVLRGLPGIGFKLNKSGDFDIECKRLCNVGNPLDEFDGVNLGYVKEKLSDIVEHTSSAASDTIQKASAIFQEQRQLLTTTEQQLKEAIKDKQNTTFEKRLKENNNEVIKEMRKYIDDEITKLTNNVVDEILKLRRMINKK